ncbi:MAG: EAL domain-containing protein [Pseudomonadaceae bacterium]|nr:EAL domain-containing protein [Pseudomonadaceae bacterium]
MTEDTRTQQAGNTTLILRYYPATALLALVMLWFIFFYTNSTVSPLQIALTIFFSLPLVGGSYFLYKQQQKLQEEVLKHKKTHSELLNQRQKISQAMEASKLGLWEWDLETDSIYHSHFHDIFGYEEHEIPHFMGHLQPLVHPDDYPRLRQEIINSLKGNSPHFQCRFRIRHKSGQWRWLKDHGEVVERNSITGTAKKMLGTRRDITAEQEKDDHLQLAWKAFESSSEATYIIDPDSQVIFINQAFVDITGYSRQDILDKDFWSIPCFSEAKDFYEKISRNLKGEGRWEGELVQKRSNGESYHQWLRVLRVRNSFQQKPYTIGIFSDMTQSRQVEARLNYLAEYDELTGLANRGQFYDRMHQTLALARLHKQDLALIVFDIDRFKAYNNSLGHHAGDQLLKLAAERISKVLTSAVVISRTGGNEFAALIKGNEQQALLLSEELQEQMHLPFNIDRQELRLTLSVGVSCYPGHSHELQVLLNQADQARLSCKALSGNRIQVYNDTIRQSSLELLRLEQDLRKALETGGIEVHFQPKLDLKTNTITAAEALARWHHPDQGFISPAVFIPLAERTGLIETLGLQVLDQSCKQAASWYHQGIKIQVAVNIAAQQLDSGLLLQQVNELLDKYELPARMLELELTESTLMEDAEAAIIEMQNLRNRGVSLAIDDFGTGYSSLSYLQRFPLDILKIDRSFLMTDQGNKNQGTLTKAIIALGHGLGMRVVAEGVEEQQQLEELKLLGCDFAQGFIISRPVPAAKFTELLEQQL